MNIDRTGLKRIQSFMELIESAKQSGSQPSFVTTPTEHGDNINVVATIEGERRHAGMLFWDLNFLQQNGLVETLDDEDLELGMTITDGMVEDAERILIFVNAELEK